MKRKLSSKLFFFHYTVILIFTLKTDKLSIALKSNEKLKKAEN